VPEIDFKTAHEANLHGLPDDDQVLAIAAREGRIPVTQDQRTMPAAFGEFIKANNSPGVLIIPQKRDETRDRSAHASVDALELRRIRQFNS